MSTDPILPSRPVASFSLPARPSFALPSRPQATTTTTDRPPSIDSSLIRFAAPPPRRQRSFSPRSPSPPPRKHRDDWDRDDLYRPDSPREVRLDWESRDSYIPHRSPSPPLPRERLVADSYRPTRASASPSRRRDSYTRSTAAPIASSSRSPSEERSPPPKSFFTHSHLKAEKDRQRSQGRHYSEDRDESAWKRYNERRTAEEAKTSLKDRLGGFAPAFEQTSYSVASSDSQLKRPASPTSVTEPPAKRIPTGPRAHSGLTGPAIPLAPRNALSGPSQPSLSYDPSPTSGSTPSGPRALSRSSRPIPTGPKALSAPLARYSTATATAPTPEPESDEVQTESDAALAHDFLNFTRKRSSSPRSPHASRFYTPDLETDDMPGPSRRGRGGASGANGHGSSRRSGPSGRGGASTASAGAPLPGPLKDQAYIENTYGAGVVLKAQFRENPKSPLANFFGAGSGHGAGVANEFTAVEGVVNGKKVYRVTIVAEPSMGIIGVGDAPVKKEAEKLAALSAVYQLTKAGILEKGQTGASAKASVAAMGIPSPQSANSDTTAKLSDGSVINYDRARQFMEYYCQRYKFGKPELEYTSTSQKARQGRKTVSQSAWEAVMTVGGRRIGMGSASSKKGAQTKCYLDVTQYLESCDRDLWQDFTDHAKNDKGADLGMAPRLLFQLSDALNDDIYGLCGDIKQSSLYRKAPATGVAIEAAAAPVWSGRRVKLDEAGLKRKSEALQAKLVDYQADPKLEKMRAVRHALPVFTKASDILAKIEINDVTIIMAATGSGKTTQIPQIIFDDYINRGEGARCNIVCTQPRRLAAMSVAERIADERGERIGNEVGYQVRFDAKFPQPNGSITFCTTGIFLKRMQSCLGSTASPQAVEQMDEITHIVVDEVHERDIDVDLLLVVLKRLMADRKARGVPLKVILMSATIDPTLFKEYFRDARGRPAPIAEVPGRTFPVAKYYLDDFVHDLRREPSARWIWNEKNVSMYLDSELCGDPARFGPDTGMALEIPYPLVALTVAHVMRQSDDGHVLVFLPGWDEIKKTADILLDPSKPLLGQRFTDASKYSVHYLHSTIPAAEQREVFNPPPPGVRRIILATNIAETSVTIPDVVYVVDSARVKEKRYDPERHMSSLVSAWVGSSNLQQRAGRAGRHREGEYYGLLSKHRMAALAPHQTVEMKREDLSNVVMHVKALNLGEVETVLGEAIEPPEPSRVVAAMEQLRQLGALDHLKNLTSLGRVLLQIPVEAAIGKLCLFGSFFRCLDSALTLAAVLSSRDPFLAPIAAKREADEIKDSWAPPAFRSDALAIVAAYKQWNEIDEMGDRYRATEFCHRNFLSKPTMLQIKQVKGSLLQALDQAGVIAVSGGGGFARSLGRRPTVPAYLNENGNSLPLLAALISLASAPNFAIRTSKNTCRTNVDKTVIIHGSSVNSQRRELGGPEEPSASFNPNEKRLYAFTEKSRIVPLGAKPGAVGTTSLRQVTRLDPMTYMLFGAYDLVVTQSGLEADAWLPITGNLHALDDIQRLKTLLDACMLRVFEGVEKALRKGRDARWSRARDSVKVQHAGSSRIAPDTTNDNNDGDEGENESDDDDDEAKKRIVEPLSGEEIKELELLTTDVVRILDAYAAEREGGSVVASRPHTPGIDLGGTGMSRQGSGNGMYRPPQAGMGMGAGAGAPGGGMARKW